MLFKIMNLVYLLLLITLFSSSESRLLNLDSDTYKAAIVEYHQTIKETPRATMENALNEYLDYIAKAANESADIIVFPEATLNRLWFELSNDFMTKVPSEKDHIIPCNEDTSYGEDIHTLKKLSCAAILGEIYVVVNVAEYIDCNATSNNECQEDNKMRFNTNVVFDRKGKIISVYRKIHLFGEKGYTGSLDKALGIFDTDFNVKFGQMICFDILYQEPTLQMIEREKINNFVYPTMWFSELPSVSAVQVQQTLAYIHNVNLLAANANNPVVGTYGSGIYLGRKGAAAIVINSKNKSTMRIADVPKSPESKTAYFPPKYTNDVDPNEQDGIQTSSENMTIHVSALIYENETLQTHTLTYDGSTCEFELQLNPNFVSKKTGTNHYIYRAVMFNGVRSITYVTAGFVECAIVACTNSNLTSCGLRFDKYKDIKPTIEISKITIKATVQKPVFSSTLNCHNIVYYPTSLLYNLVPLNVDQFNYTIEDGKNTEQIKLQTTMLTPQSELLAFGFFGRIFEEDNMPVTVNTNDLTKKEIMVVKQKRRFTAGRFITGRLRAGTE